MGVFLRIRVELAKWLRLKFLRTRRRARCSMLRVLEYHSWADPRGGRPIVKALHTVIYGFTTVGILCALWINIIYGVKFPQEKANDWIISSVATLATDYLLAEIIVIVFTVTLGEKLGKLYEAFNGGG